MNIVFFGSFQHYSATILESLLNHQSPGTKDQGLVVSAVVTTPPMPVGRKQIITKTPVHLLAEKHGLPVYTPKTLTPGEIAWKYPGYTPGEVSKSDEADDFFGAQSTSLPEGLHGERAEPDAFRQPSTQDGKSEGNNIDLFITAGYGKILPKSWLEYPKLGALNLHFSLLPAYRGANPAEWAIMCGEIETGITLIKMSSKLDAGDIIAQAKIPITENDTRETLYQKLYTLGANLLPQWLQQVAANGIFSAQICQAAAPTTQALQKTDFKFKPQPQISPTPYAALLKRDDGFIPWTTIQKAMSGQTLNLKDFPSPHLRSALSFYLDRDGLQSEHAQPDAFRQSSMRDCKPSIENFLSRLPRALASYPSLWTIVKTNKGNKRMKILSFQALGTRHQALNIVQLEGHQPSQFNQIKNQLTI